MPHKHNDIKHGVDPEQIRRYLAGELDDKAMHLLEKQALDDPFLADALEGFAEHAPDQRINLADLESRLEQRVAGKKERKLPVYYRWAAAAAILLLIGVGLTQLWQLPEKKEVAKAEVLRDSVAAEAVTNENGAAVEPKPDLVLSDIKPAPAPVVSLPPVRKEAATIQRDDAPAGDIQSSEVMAAPVQEAPALAKAKKSEMVMMDTVADRAYVAAAVPAPEKDKSVMLRGSRIPGIYVTPSSPAPKRMLQGRVTDGNNDPLQAVTVMSSTNNAVVTDQEGKFAIQVDSTKDVQLNLRYVGFESKKLKVDEKENNLTIAMNEASSRLDEVVVAYGNTKRKQRVADRAPVPTAGFDDYQKYLVKNVKYPALAGDIRGNVKVRFTVDTDGTLRHFKVIRKLQPDCDAEAIRVIKEGPSWTPASNGKSAKVEVEVPFNP